MTHLKCAALIAMAVLAGCADTHGDKTTDRGVGAHRLGTLSAGIWIDPRGCDHWIIDDGAEGYLSQRLDRYGKPVCSGAGPPNTAIGPFKAGATIGDLF